MKSKCSSVDMGAVLKNIVRFSRHPWIAGKFLALQGEKVLFNQLYPRFREGSARKIRQLSIRITDLCNLRCTTCGQWGSKGFLHGKDLRGLKRQEVTVERYLSVFADLVHQGHHPFVYFWGGEPMLYDGILDLIESGTRMGLPVSIATNGTRIASAASRLVNAPLFLLQISIDGHCAELHNRIRPGAGGGDNFGDIVAGLDAVGHARRAQRNNLPLVASLTTISQPNVHHLVDIYEAFRHRVDLFVFYLSWWIDEERADCHEVDFSRRFGFSPTLHRGWIGDWKPAGFDALSEQIKDLQRRSRSLKSPPVVMIPNISGAHNLERYYRDHSCRFGFDRCISIYQVVEVDSDGDISPCRDYHDYVVGNMKTATITELWNSPAYRRFRRSLSTEGLMPVCSRCCGLMGY